MNHINQNAHELSISETREFIRKNGYRGDRRLRLIDISGRPFFGYDYELVEQRRRKISYLSLDGYVINDFEWEIVRKIVSSRMTRCGDRSYATTFSRETLENAWSPSVTIE